MNLYEILQNSDRVGEGMTHFERLFAQKVGGGKINEISGVPPLRYIGDGRPLTDYRIAGNTVQDGTPSPEAPVDATGCGVRTGNLANLYGVDKTSIGLHYTTGDDMTIVVNGTKVNGANVHPLVSPNIILPAGVYTVKVKMVSGSITNISDGLFFGINRSTYSQRTTPALKQVGDVGKRTFTLSEDTLLSTIDITPGYGTGGSVWENATFECWLYSGSDGKEYEPYGFKLPPTVNGTEYPIYLGQVETTRRIKKLVLDGTEDWRISGSGDSARFYINIADAFASSSLYCTHFTNGVQTTSGNCEITASKNLAFNNSGIATTTSNWKTCLSAQYAAGTPVTVWYVLAEPETAIVNEPLMKIGDYADTVSFAQTGVTIPTVNGENVLDVPTTVPPSEVWIRGKIKEV